MCIELNNKTNTEEMKVKYEALIKPSKPSETLIKITNKKQIKTTKRKSQSLLINVLHLLRFSCHVYRILRVCLSPSQFI